MKQKKILTLTLSQLKQLYKQELPALISIAQNSPNEEKFKIQLNAFIDTIPTNNTQETIKMLIDYDGKSIFELSTGQNIQIKTISLLYRFLTENLNDEETPTDLFIDLYFLFKGSENNYTSPSLQQIKKRTHLWESGLDKKVIEIMANYLGLKEEEITSDMDLMDDLNINSYDIMSIIGRFEDEFDIEVPDEDIRNFITVADVINYIKKQN